MTQPTESERLAMLELRVSRLQREVIDNAPSILLTIGAACGIAAYMACCYFIWKETQKS